MSTTSKLLFLFFFFNAATSADLPGVWELLVPDAGIASMHTAVTRFNTVVLLDRTHIGPSRKLLPKDRCLVNPANPHRKDCTAHSVLLDLQTNNIRPLTILTDTWCSSGQFLPMVASFKPAAIWMGSRNSGSSPPVNRAHSVIGKNCRILSCTREDGDYSSATVVVCGGAEYGAYLQRMTDSPAHGSCGRIEATRPDPGWEMEDMPFGRIMGDMVMLPTGDVLIINGAQAGTQGFELASEPCLYPVLYRPDQPLGLRFMTLNPGTVPRMYHSTANLLPDGRILIAGSNPHYFYKFNAEFPTELRIEAFSPEYLSADKANIRPSLVELPERVGYGEVFEAGVTVELPVVGIVEVNFASAPFATHSFSQGQRLVKLLVETPTVDGGGRYRIKCTAPPNGKVAPPGYYMAFAVNQGVPSVAKWVQLLA
ncbi:UNVERIFIED_CONTAM: Aldehyde oxidase GLOX [Sesamum latifolium]|uniref:Aldehyde oxidase GLOX n=1 Tax=Sesamum latifolium TaxID=2727402 RepID=A0AAW2XBS8_9LAMI